MWLYGLADALLHNPRVTAVGFWVANWPIGKKTKNFF